MNTTMRTPMLRSDRGLFLAAAIGIPAIVFAGFARSYFLRPLFFRDGLSLLVHVHGAVMAAWFVLFLVQTGLIERHRVAWHRKLGVFGVCLAIAMVFLGPYVAWRAALRESRAHGADADFTLLVFGFDCVIMALFAVFVGCAIAWRKRGDWHKRLMLLATLSLLVPAISRVPVDLIRNDDSGWVTILLADSCVLIAVAIDTYRQRRLHRVFAVGAPLIVLATGLAFIGAQTNTWLAFARATLN